MFKLSDIYKNSTVRKFFGSIFTQGLLSANNLITGIIIARNVTKDEYALYIIAFSIVLNSVSYQSALITTPLMVIAPQKKGDDKNRFISGLGYGQGLFLPVLALILLGTVPVCLWRGSFKLFYQALTISFAIVGYFIMEFFRTLNYSNLKIRMVIVMDTVFVFFVLPAIWILVKMKHLTGMSAISVLGAGFYISSFIGAKALGRKNLKYSFSYIKNSLKEAWQYSRWALIGVTATILQGQGYLYIVSLMVGLSETANMSVARIFAMPVLLCVSSSVKILVAKGAEIFGEGGIKKLNRFIFNITIFLFLFWCLYVLFLWIFHKPLLDLIYKGKYSGIEWHLAIWGGLALISLLRFPVSNELQVCLEFKALANYGVISAIITTGLCLLLTRYYGGYGALISLGIGELILFFLCIYKVYVITAQEPKILELTEEAISAAPEEIN